MLRTMWRWLRRLWRKPPAAEQPPIAPPARPNKPLRATPLDDIAVHYRFEHLLDDLDDYFKVMRDVKRADRETYLLHRLIGAQVIPWTALAVFDAAGQMLPGEWRGQDRKRMFAGMVYYSGRTEEVRKNTGGDDDIIPAAFVGFKRTRPFFVPKPEDVDYFEVTVYWYFGDRPEKWKEKQPSNTGLGTYWVAVDPAGNISVIKSPHVITVPLPATRHRIHRSVTEHYNGGPSRPTGDHRMAFQRRVWDYGYLPTMLKDLKELYPDDYGDVTMQELGARIFACCVQYAYWSEGGLQVRVRREGIVARFNIGMLRTPYFFRQRERVVNDRGKTRRIFHIVRAHRRVREAGTVSYVKSHFRGLRKFNWKGYAVVVSMPGLHHSRPAEMDMSAVEYPLDVAHPADSVPAHIVGAQIAKHMEEGT